MPTRAENTTIEGSEAPSAAPSSALWRRVLLVLVLAGGAGLMVAWIVFLGWAFWVLARAVLP